MIRSSDIRNGYDEDLEDTNSDSVVDCSVEQDMTRQEFKLETDVNHIMRRFEQTGQLPAQRQPLWGDHDFDLDLHTSFIAVEDAQRAFIRLPEKIREKYQTPQGLLDAIWRGEFKEDLTEEITKPADQPETAPAVQPASTGEPQA